MKYIFIVLCAFALNANAQTISKRNGSKGDCFVPRNDVYNLKSLIHG